MEATFLFTLWRSVLPFALILLSGQAFILTLHTTHRWLRSIFLALTLSLSLEAIRQGITDFGIFASLASNWAQLVINQMLHAIAILLLQGFQSQGLTITNNVVTWKGRAMSLPKLWNNPRRLPIRGSLQGVSDTAELPTTSRYALFYASNLAKVAVLYYAHFHFLPMLFSETIVTLQSEDLLPEKQQVFRRLGATTGREILVRMYVSYYWIWEDFVCFDCVHTAMAFFFVTIGHDSPEEWPPLFGNITRATGVRRFWSEFWHQLVVPTYKDFGEVAAKALRLRPRSRAWKSVVALTIFLVSGLAHSVVSYVYRQPAWVATFWWFALNFAACFVETLATDLAAATARRFGLSKELRHLENSWVGYFVAYSYLLIFFFWSVPKWKYPDLYASAVHVEALNELRDLLSFI